MGTLLLLMLMFQNLFEELKGVEIEISVFGSFEGVYIDMDYFTEYSDDFVNKWA